MKKFLRSFNHLVFWLAVCVVSGNKIFIKGSQGVWVMLFIISLGYVVVIVSVGKKKVGPFK